MLHYNGYVTDCCATNNYSFHHDEFAVTCGCCGSHSANMVPACHEELSHLDQYGQEVNPPIVDSDFPEEAEDLPF